MLPALEMALMRPEIHQYDSTCLLGIIDARVFRTGCGQPEATGGQKGKRLPEQPLEDLFGARASSAGGAK